MSPPRSLLPPAACGTRSQVGRADLAPAASGHLPPADHGHLLPAARARLFLLKDDRAALDVLHRLVLLLLGDDGGDARVRQRCLKVFAVQLKVLAGQAMVLHDVLVHLSQICDVFRLQ